MQFGSNAIARATPGTKRGKSLGQCSMAKAVITLEDLPNHQYQISVIFLPPTNGGWEKAKNSAAVAQAVRIMNDSYKPSGVSMRMVDGGFEIKQVGEQS